MRAFAAIIFAITCGLSVAAFAADPIGDAIDRARAAYQTGNLIESRKQLDAASQLMLKKNVERLGDLLPVPPKGWTTNERATKQVDADIAVATRTYKNGKGQNIEVQIASDPALLAQFNSVMNNSWLSKAMGDPVAIGKRVALQNPDGDINLLVAGKCLITVTGTADPDDKVEFTKIIDAAKLERL